ncbi:MAG: group II intron reverse transcriptase/maturase [Crocosphaera sp.]
MTGNATKGWGNAQDTLTYSDFNQMKNKPVVANMEKASLKTTISWNTINWAKVQRKVFKLQKRIFQAVKSGDKVKARKLQKLLTKSFFAKLLAVRKVTQENTGKKTAGIDGKTVIHPKQRINLALKLTIKGYKSQPLRRLWIPKPRRDEKRLLGIPTIQDRAMQSLVKLAIEPYWEALFEETSYGFRPGRSSHDAIENIFLQIKAKPKFVLDADIAKCFDTINHDYLLKKVDNPHYRKIIKQWLKAGVMDNSVFEETTKGTPQGGSISPLLANVALDGMIRDIRKSYPKSISKNGVRIYNYQPSIIRYADDFVVFHQELEVINQCKELINKWLDKVGLKLKPEKIRICHSLNDIEINGKKEKAGFDFLGFNIRSYPVGKYHSGKNSNGAKIGFKTIIKPSSKAIKTNRDAIKEVFQTHSKAPQGALISRLNPIIKGWSNYYSTVCSAETFKSQDNYIWSLLRAWILGRSQKGKQKAFSKYFSDGVNGQWTFQTQEGNGIHIHKYSKTEIKRHILVRGNSSPYDGNWPYWSKRRGNYPQTPKRLSKLLKRQKGKCNLCNQYFSP